ncbi:MAG: glycosyltransferase family 2 protein [Ilumatobacteraceae bacterium]
MSHGQRTETASGPRSPLADAFPAPRSWSNLEHGWPAPRHRFAFVVASLNGAGAIGATITACSGQADTFVVSDGSTDNTAEVARRHGATAVVELAANVGKPAAIHAAVRQLRLLDLYELICIVDDDTIVDANFVEATSAAFRPGVSVVCAKTVSDWGHAQRWNPIVANRAFAYWKYQSFIRRGQSALGVMNCISGSNSVYRASFLNEVLRSDTPYVVDDTYWVLEAQRRNLGRIVYCPETSAKVQEPTSVRAWYKQNLRWLWGTFQGVIGHKVGRKATKFDVAYLGMMLDWLLYTFVTPVFLAYVLVANTDRLGHVAVMYGIGYTAWAAIGAIALRRWRLLLLWPALALLDWVARVNFIHAAIKAIRQPTSACRWESPARYSTPSSVVQTALKTKESS